MSLVTTRICQTPCTYDAPVLRLGVSRRHVKCASLFLAWLTPSAPAHLRTVFVLRVLTRSQWQQPPTVHTDVRLRSPTNACPVSYRTCEEAELYRRFFANYSQLFEGSRPECRNSSKGIYPAAAQLEDRHHPLSSRNIHPHPRCKNPSYALRSKPLPDATHACC